MAITATHLNDAIASPQSTLSVTPVTLGNCMAVAVFVGAAPGTTTAISCSGGGVGAWQVGYTAAGDGSTYTVAMFYGKITTTGAQTLTIVYGGTIGTTTTEVVAVELSDGAAREWGVWGTGGPKANTSSTTVTFTAIKSATSAADQCYFGYAGCGNAAVLATVGGFTLTPLADANGNGWLFGTVASNTTATPTITAGQSPAGISKTHGMILGVSNIRNTGVGVFQAVKRSNIF